MEQRALLAVALVAGSVTAAGAGGYLAVRQMVQPAGVAPSQASPVLARDAASGTEGTEADILPGVTSSAAEASPERAPAPKTVPQAAVPAASSAPAARVAAPARPRPVEPVARPVPAAPRQAAPRQASPSSSAAAPAAATGRQEFPYGSSPAPPAAPVPRVETRPAPATPTAPRDDADWSSSNDRLGRDTSTAAGSDRWPQPEAEATGAVEPLPNRATLPEPAPAPAAVRRLESVTIPADSVIGVQLEHTISTETARVEDPVRARVTRDVRVGGNVVVPAGSRLLGSVTLVEDGGKIRERARLGVRFHTLVLADGTQVTLPTETIYRDGESPAGRSAAKIGGAAAGGAILGAILGGGKGALIGAATGAGGGTAAAMAGERRPAELRSGQPITVRVTDGVATTIER